MGLGERYKLLQWGSGRSSGRQRISVALQSGKLIWW